MERAPNRIQHSPEPDIEPESYFELRASEQRYRKLIHNVPLPLWQVDTRAMSDVMESIKAAGITDIDGYLKERPKLVELASQAVVVTEVNDSAMRLFRGSDRPDFLRSVQYLFSGTPDAAARVMQAHFESRRNYVEEMQIHTFDGQLLDVVLLVTFPQAPESLDLTLIMMIDLTEQRRTEQQLRKVEADFAHAARISALGELVTSIAHEVRQPLSVIVTDADTGLRWLDRDEPNLLKVKSLITRIMENGHRANEVIRRVKDMAIKSTPVRQPVNLNAVANEAAILVRTESQAHSIAVRMRLAHQLPLISGDRVQLQQVVVNLLINSIQAIASSGKSVREIIIETGLDKHGMARLSVRDSGWGIPPEHIDKIFDGFFSTKPDGIGMGLAICRSIITDHGGTIKMENSADGGAEFQIGLPISEIGKPRIEPTGPDLQPRANFSLVARQALSITIGCSLGL